MPTNPNTAFRFNELDKAALVELSTRLQMNRTETIRVLVRETLAVLKEKDQAATVEREHIDLPSSGQVVR
jgi:hypothetical protein